MKSGRFLNVLFFFSQFKFFVDLEKIYTDSKKYPMFKLAKTDTTARNIFKLQIRLHFIEKTWPEVFESPVFRCRTKKVDGMRTFPANPLIYISNWNANSIQQSGYVAIR